MQSLAEASLTPGAVDATPLSPLAEEIYLILEGGGTMEIDEESTEVGPGRRDPDPGRRVARAAGGADGARLLCCCVPAYTHDDTYFE